MVEEDPLRVSLGAEELLRQAGSPSGLEAGEKCAALLWLQLLGRWFILFPAVLILPTLFGSQGG